MNFTGSGPASQSLYRGPMAADLGCIPAELKTCCQWVLWRGEDRINQQTGEVKLNKIPIDPQTLLNASTTEPETWGTFAQCVAALPVALEAWEQDNPDGFRGGGIGYVFSDEDPYSGIDLDHCRTPDTGALAPWAQVHVDALASYTEVTPSGTGLHTIVQGALPPKGRKKGHVETYDYARFFTVTGWHVPETPRTIESRQAELTTFHTAIFGPPETPREHTQTVTVTLEDTALLAKAHMAGNGAKFTRLYDAGDTSMHGGDDSGADLALCTILAFWTQDAAQIDRLFRQSGLMRDKWDAARGTQTYGGRTIAEALARQTEHYRPPYTASQQRNGDTVEPAPRDARDDTRPVIRIGPDITRLVDEGEAALLALPEGPVLFQRARRVSIIARGVKPPKWLHRPADAPVIVEGQARYLDELATQAARWEKFDKRAKKGEEWQEVTPPARFVETLQARPSWRFPLLEGIIQSPTLRPDGSVLLTPGYDPDTGLFFDSNGTVFPPLPERVTLDQARSALGRLQEVTRNFPWAIERHDFSAWLAAVCTVVCRYTIMGCVPLFGITATTRGSGKSLLADTIAIIGTGHTAARWSQVFDEDEERKRLLSLALDGDPLVCIDNITVPLGSGALAMTLTSGSVKDRLLGVNQTKEAPMSAVFLATGNNLQYIGDVARRVVPIALDPKMERPEERTDFHHTPLLPWVEKERPTLTMAALTIIKAFFDEGRPAQGLTPFGSFDAWSDLIRHALVWLGEADPCEGRKTIEANSNPDFETLAGVLDTWHACYGTVAVTLAHVGDDIDKSAQHIGPETTRNNWNDLQDALGSCDKRYDGKRLDTTRVGNALRKWQGRVIDSKRLVVLPEKADGNKTLWKIDRL